MVGHLDHSFDTAVLVGGKQSKDLLLPATTAGTCPSL